MNDGDRMTGDEREQGARVVAQFGHRAHQIHDGLREAFKVRDGYRAGQLCKQMWESPDLMMLVVSLLLSTPASGPLATPEEMGMDTSEVKPALWQVAANDQVEAAYESGDFPAYARILTDTWVKAIVMDLRNYREEEGEWPTSAYILRGTMVAPQEPVTAVAAECLWRLAMEKIRGG